ncbi:MAG: hypothetical protein JWM19_1184 [Actinomycetia bacterium]|nr:hypothetical protein [Actinomycetes bacterium]
MTAFALGFSGLGAGGVAVFVTHLEAGPIGLLAVGLVFMIIGLSGTLPTRLKVGDNEASWEIEKQAVETFVERVAETTPAANRREFLGALTDLAEDAPEVASRGISIIAYEQLLRAELEEVVRELERSFPDGQPVEFITEAATNRPTVGAIIQGPTGRYVAVEARLSIRNLGEAWLDANYDYLIKGQGQPGLFDAILLISRESATPAFLKNLSRYPGTYYVSFRGPEDKGALKQVLSSLLSLHLCTVPRAGHSDASALEDWRASGYPAVPQPSVCGDQ